MHILIFEPRLGGHHLSWLRYITEDFLSAGHRLTLCLNGQPAAVGLYRENLGDLLPLVRVLSAFDPSNHFRGGSRIQALGHCLGESGAEQVFVNNLDDIASAMFRRAAVGLLPRSALRGRLSGVYFRPRFLQSPLWPPGNILKAAGFRRMAQEGWFHRILLLDEYLCERHADRWPRAGLLFLPDTWSGAFDLDPVKARRDLGIASDRFVFLHYGIGTRRKGLHLILRAMLAENRPAHWHLLCAGEMAGDGRIARDAGNLAQRGAGTFLNRYVSKEEEAACLAAADVVLLPYIRHFGSSGVLALAAAAGKMVVVSDEGLIARRVRQKHLGICFAPGDAAALQGAMARAEEKLKSAPGLFSAAASRFAADCNRQAFRRVLLSVYPDPGSTDVRPPRQG